MKDIEKRLGHVEVLVRRMNNRFKNIIDTRKHYLKNKAKKNGKTMAKLVVLVRKLEHLEKALGTTRLTMEGRGDDRTSIMFTAYERTKLRALLAPDYRRVFRCSAEDAAVLTKIIEGARVA